MVDVVVMWCLSLTGAPQLDRCAPRAAEGFRASVTLSFPSWTRASLHSHFHRCCCCSATTCVCTCARLLFLSHFVRVCERKSTGLHPDKRCKETVLIVRGAAVRGETSPPSGQMCPQLFSRWSCRTEQQLPDGPDNSCTDTLDHY